MVTITKPYSREKVMADNPTLSGVVGEVKFYEHPKFGDESPLIADTGDQFGLTDHWELPSLEEIQ